MSAIAAIVPSVVEAIVEITAIKRLLVSASKTRRFWKRASYQLKVKPVQTALILDSLKEYMARISSGR